MTVFYKMRQILLLKGTAISLQNTTNLLQNATFITNCNSTPSEYYGILWYGVMQGYTTYPFIEKKTMTLTRCTIHYQQNMSNHHAKAP